MRLSIFRGPLIERDSLTKAITRVGAIIRLQWGAFETHFHVWLPASEVVGPAGDLSPAVRAKIFAEANAYVRRHYASGPPPVAPAPTPAPVEVEERNDLNGVVVPVD